MAKKAQTVSSGDAVVTEKRKRGEGSAVDGKHQIALRLTTEERDLLDTATIVAGCGRDRYKFFQYCLSLALTYDDRFANFGPQFEAAGIAALETE